MQENTTVTPNFEGNGLGLTITKSILKFMGG